MKRFVVGYVDFVNNNLILEMIYAENKSQARWKHTRMIANNFRDECRTYTKHMNDNQFQQWCFDNENLLVSVIEISEGM
jgi:hypothetical protein